MMMMMMMMMMTMMCMVVVNEHFGVVGVGDCDDDDDGDASMYISVHHKIDFFLDVFLLTCSTIAPAYFTENAPAMVMAPNTTA